MLDLDDCLRQTAVLVVRDVGPEADPGEPFALAVGCSAPHQRLPALAADNSEPPQWLAIATATDRRSQSPPGFGIGSCPKAVRANVSVNGSMALNW